MLASPLAEERRVDRPASPAGAPPLEIASLAFAHDDAPVLADVSLCLLAGECLGVFGPTGAGKTTLLRLLAGLLPPSHGEIRLAGQPASSAGRVLLPPHRRGVAMVFQGGALWPYIDARGHLTEVLRARGVAPAAACDRAQALLARVSLESLADRLPASLSGGEQQRLALARALAAEPRGLLLDEPFAAVDEPTRDRLLRLLEDVRRDSGACVMYVTHDVHDALENCDRVAVLRGGRIEQVDVPARLYREPASSFVATCVGFASFLPGVRVSAGECVTRWGCFPISGGAEGGKQGFLALRPEALRLDPQGPLRGVVLGCGFRDGAHALRIDCDGPQVLCLSTEPRARGESVTLAVHAPGVFVLE